MSGSGPVVDPASPVTLDAVAATAGPLHVFAYGSLLWRPGFPYRYRQRARLHGFHRALRVWSVHHRGTEDRPGLVLGLDRGGSCIGCVYEVDPDHRREVAQYLWEREMVTSVYQPRRVWIRREGDSSGRPTPALTFVLDRAHAQYAGVLSAEDAVQHVFGAVGQSGDNLEYVRETVRGLQRLGIHDHGLQAVLRLLETERAPSAGRRSRRAGGSRE